MGGQGIARREVLRYIGLAAIAGTFPGFSRWAFACPHNAMEASPAQAAADVYEPLFFAPPQFLMIEQLAGMIIPADDTPGAKEAGVAEFIDFMVANRAPVSSPRETRSTEDTLRVGSEIQEQFVTGIAWLDARSKFEFGNQFLNCSAEQQNSLLSELAYKAKYTPTTEIGRKFFQLMRDYTVVGYYTTKIGLESLGDPGLRTVWPKMPGCTHPDDPEHARLREPGQLKLAELGTAK